MTEPTDEAAREPARTEAAAWFARMRGPDAQRLAPEFERWRSETPENEAAYQRLLRKWDQTAFLANTRIGKDRDLGRAIVWPRRPLVRFAAAAGAILLAGGIGVMILGRSVWTPSERASIDYASIGGRIREVRLADGTRVTLDAGAAVRVDAAQGRARLVKGRARFEVASSLRFVVDCGDNSIVASDSQFDVSLQGGITKVVAWRGAVDVSRALDGRSGRPVRIAGGQMLAVAPSAAPFAPRPADAGEIAWTRGMLSFDDIRLADAIDSINRYNHRHITLGSPAIGGLRVTGAFRASDPQGFARAVAGMFHLSVGILPDGTILLTPETKA